MRICAPIADGRTVVRQIQLGTCSATEEAPHLEAEDPKN
jgi:hypothetical protein